VGIFVKDSGWQGLRGTVQRCGACSKATVHFAARGGVPVCSECGYNPAFDRIADDSDTRVTRFGRFFRGSRQAQSS
jgi:uncharacterized protein (DUF983 family)